MKSKILIAGIITVFVLLTFCSCDKNSDIEQPDTVKEENYTEQETDALFEDTEQETDALFEDTTMETVFYSDISEPEKISQTENTPTSCTQEQEKTTESTTKAENDMGFAQKVSSMLNYLTQSVKPDYYQKVVTEKPLERKYTDKGAYAVSYVEYKATDKKIGKFEIWYPTEISNANGKYPLVVMANGTGVKASSYKAIFDHLASWGFIVVGNEDESSWNGVSCEQSLNLMISLNSDKTSLFYNKIDVNNIGVAGHSQGGVGAINAVTAQQNGNLYKAIYTASTPHLALAQALSWPYDVSKIKIPYFMTAGTMQVDAGNGKDPGIAPLFSLEENYNAISGNVPKIFARRVNTDHGDMLPYADGYMTAWFMYYLKGDKSAGNAFFGQNAEILTNSNWQDIKKNL